MKCEIVQDLLPAYISGLTSEETNLELDKHFEECKNCQELRADLMKDETINLPKASPIEIEMSKKIEHRMFFQKLFFILIPFVLILAFGIIEYFVKVPVAFPSEYKPTVYELESGDLYVEFTLPLNATKWSTEDETTLENYKQLKEQGAQSYEMKIELYQTVMDLLRGSYEEKFPYATWPTVIHRSTLLREEGSFESFKGIKAPVRSEKGNEYKIIWKEGDPIEPASDEIEERAKEINRMYF